MRSHVFMMIMASYDQETVQYRWIDYIEWNMKEIVTLIAKSRSQHSMSF